MSDYLILDIPNFEPKYDSEVIYTYKGSGGDKLKKLLEETSDGHCMYCFINLLIDGKNLGELEHSIEKFNSEDILKDCSINMSLACRKCNSSFKKQGEKKRLVIEAINKFNSKMICKKNCSMECSEYRELKKDYISSENGKIILQPFGVSGIESKLKYFMQYDILNQRFKVKISDRLPYTEKDKEFINAHINRFNLNDEKYRTRELFKFIEDVIEFNKIPRVDRYNNFMVNLFVEKLKELDAEKAIKLCGIIYSNILMKNKN